MTQVLQLLINGLMTGAVLALPAVAFNLIFAVVRISNFSLAAHMTAGAFIGYFLSVGFGLPFYLVIGLTFLATGLVGVASDGVALRAATSSSAARTG